MCSSFSSNWQKWPPSWLRLAFWCVKLRQRCRRTSLRLSLSAPWPNSLSQMSALMWVTVSSNRSIYFHKKTALISPFLHFFSHLTDLQPGSADARWLWLPERLRSAAVCPRHQSTSDPRRWDFITVIWLISLYVTHLSCLVLFDSVLFPFKGTNEVMRMIISRNLLTESWWIDFTGSSSDFSTDHIVVVFLSGLLLCDWFPETSSAS